MSAGKYQKCKSVAEPKEFYSANLDKKRCKNPYISTSVDLQTFQVIAIMDIKIDKDEKFHILVRATFEEGPKKRAWVSVDKLNSQDEERNDIEQLVANYGLMLDYLKKRFASHQAYVDKKKKIKDLLLEYVRFSKFKERMTSQPAEPPASAPLPEQDLIEKYGGQLKHYPNRAQLFEKYFREDCEPTLRNLEASLEFDSYGSKDILAILNTLRMKLLVKYIEKVSEPSKFANC